MSHDLIAVLSQGCEPGNDSALREWIAERKSADPLHAFNGPATASGNSALEVAVALGCDHAVRVLLSEGADVNAVLTGETSPRAIHLAAAANWDEIVRVLLEFNADLTLTTNDGVTRLGQTLSVHSCGGGTALTIATENANFAIVSMLLESYSSNEQRRVEVLRQDFSGMSALDHAEDRLALLPETHAHLPIKQDLVHIRELFLAALSVDPATRPLPSYQAAMERKREGETQLRARVLQHKTERKEAEIRRALDAVAKHFVPKDTRIYEPSLCIIHLSDQLQHAIQQACVSRQLPQPVTCNDLPQDVLQSAIEEVTYEPQKGFGVFVTPLLQPEFCQAILEEIEHFEREAKRKNADLPQEAQLPLVYRHDGNIGSLERCGFAPLLLALTQVGLNPLARALRPYIAVRPDVDAARLAPRHAFVKRDHIAREENASFVIHRDQSHVTMNLCTSRTGQLEGSTVSFFADHYNSDAGLDASKVGDRLSLNDRDGAGAELFVYEHQAGQAVTHTGKQWHRTNAVTQGERSSLIMWADLV